MRTSLHVAPSNARPLPQQAGSAPGAPEAQEIIEGLSAAAASVSPKFFYDDLGSRLFESITRLPEYYPTRTEREIFTRHCAAMSAVIGAGATLVDLGAGNCEKAAALFTALQPSQYVAVDISAEFVREAVEGLRHRFPRTSMLALGMDFSGGLALPDSVARQRRTFFYPGSSLGNFAPLQALALLADVRRHCDDEGGLLIGIDLVKPTAIIERAYNDALGVTAAFNLNLLQHLNRLIGSDFDVSDWRHRAWFNSRLSRLEMHLEAREEVEVSWPGGSLMFRQGERIHTENSYKYTLPGIQALLQQAGFGSVQAWTDECGWFAVCHARAGRTSA